MLELCILLGYVLPLIVPPKIPLDWTKDQAMSGPIRTCCTCGCRKSQKLKYITAQYDWDIKTGGTDRVSSTREQPRSRMVATPSPSQTPSKDPIG